MVDKPEAESAPDPVPPSNLMTPDVAEAGLEFLRRTSLRGDEVDAFLRVRVALQMAALRGE